MTIKKNYTVTLVTLAILKKMSVGVTSVIKKEQEGREFLFFLRNTFKYSANVVFTNI